MDLPEEVIYKILSYMPHDNLVQLNLSHKQYWNIYRTRKTNCLWDVKINWLDRLSGTHEMELKEKLYIHSLLSLVDGFPLTFIPKIPVENTLVTFQCFLDGYIWYPDEKVDLTSMKQILNERDKSLTFFKVDNFCSNHIINLFNKHLLKHIWDKIPEDILDYCCKEYSSDDDNSDSSQNSNDSNKKYAVKHNKPQYSNSRKLIRFPDDEEIDVYLVLYLSEQILDLNLIQIEFTDEIQIGPHIIWKVLKISEIEGKVDIGRAVLSPQLHNMMNYDIGIAVFGRENKVFGLGNFNYHKAKKDVLKLLPKNVFETYNFVIVKKN